ncbi:MAG: CBS domain-containing protein [Candidatus Methanomethyliaceae archaeon]|nr:CBS domain-containing protein [Candidatus Methanomethyliaceae archaeon]
MKLTDILIKDVPILNKNRPLLDALDVLNKQGLESICISSDGKLIGTLSYRDVLFRIGAQRLRAVAPESLYISGFVKDFPALLSNDTPVRRAAKLLLELSSQALPMFYGDTFLGLVYRSGMLKLVQDSQVGTSSIIRRNFPILRAHERVINARKLLLEGGVTIIPIVNDEGRLLGVVTEKEILNSLIEFQKYVPAKHQKARIRELSVSTAMKVSMPTVEGDLSLGEASRRMIKDCLPGLIITDSSKVIGILSPEEVLEYIVGSFPEEQ